MQPLPQPIRKGDQQTISREECKGMWSRGYGYETTDDNRAVTMLSSVLFDWYKDMSSVPKAPASGGPNVYCQNQGSA